MITPKHYGKFLVFPDGRVYRKLGVNEHTCSNSIKKGFKLKGYYPKYIK